jgi:hypothetical protein
MDDRVELLKLRRVGKNPIPQSVPVHLAVDLKYTFPEDLANLTSHVRVRQQFPGGSVRIEHDRTLARHKGRHRGFTASDPSQ